MSGNNEDGRRGGSLDVGGFGGHMKENRLRKIKGHRILRRIIAAWTYLHF